MWGAAGADLAALICCLCQIKSIVAAATALVFGLATAVFGAVVITALHTKL
jgi:hypothetical protein